MVQFFGNLKENVAKFLSVRKKILTVYSLHASAGELITEKFENKLQLYDRMFCKLYGNEDLNSFHFSVYRFLITRYTFYDCLT